jgi:hypothetical protein
MRRIGLALLLGTLAFSPLAGFAGDQEHSLEQLVVEMANTPSEHAALAAHFRAKAESARAQARRHESMASAYTGGKLMQREAMKSHCQKISSSYKTMADEYEALAKLHDDASKAKQ